MRLINAEALKDDLAVLFERNEPLIDDWLVGAIDDTIDVQPDAGPRELRMATWYHGADIYGNEFTNCSECHTDYDGNAIEDGFLFCPFCGAKIIGATDREEDDYKSIEKLPSAQPERKKGQWLKISPAGIYECSACGQIVMTGDIAAYKYCHGCGARMGGTA